MGLKGCIWSGLDAPGILALVVLGVWQDLPRFPQTFMAARKLVSKVQTVFRSAAYRQLLNGDRETEVFITEYATSYLLG